VRDKADEANQAVIAIRRVKAQLADRQAVNRELARLNPAPLDPKCTRARGCSLTP